MPLLINVMLSTIYMLFMSRHYTSITQCRCYFTPLHFHFNLSTKSMRFRAILCNFPSPFLFTPHHFSFDVFHSLPSNHTNQIAASTTRNCRLFHSIYNHVHFRWKCHSAPHFDSIFTRIHSTTFIDFAPHISYLNFNYLLLLLCNNVLCLNV